MVEVHHSNVYVFLPVIGHKLPSKMGGFSILRVVVERQKRGLRCQEGWGTGGVPSPLEEGAQPPKFLIFLYGNGAFWWILGCYNLKLDTWFTTSHHRRMASFSACLTQKIRLCDDALHVLVSWSLTCLIMYR
jgi:hypothetical protein